MTSRLCVVAAVVAGWGLFGAGAAAGDRPHAGMLRYPDVSKTHIVFMYANDLWLVDRGGGMATPLASPPGQELLPRFSPDGSTIAFQGNYEGDRDLYTMPVGGGVAARVTHHPANEVLCDWTPGGGLIFASGAEFNGITAPRLYTVDAGGGLPEKLPVHYGANGAISPDGRWLAYTPNSRDFRTWKRYRGGLASDIWLFNLETNESERITDWEGTDTLPMWHADAIYYLSDAGEHSRLNIWRYNTKTKERAQVTRFEDFDIKFPAIGPGPNGKGEIVFQNGGDLMLLDLAAKKVRTVEVDIPGDRPQVRPRTINAGKFISGGGISATGKRGVASARGDIWTIPAEHGPVRQITNSSGSAQRSPAWSPDGRWIAYFSDETGEYELFVTQSDGKGETRQLTDGNETFFQSIEWAPNAESLIVMDKGSGMHLVDFESGEMTEIDRDPWNADITADWSSDSRWIVYSRSAEKAATSVIWLHDTESGETHQLTSGFFNDSDPAFDRTGDYLYYASARNFASPQYEDVGSSFVYAQTGRIIAVPLNDEVENPRVIEVDEEEWDEDEKDSDDGDDESDSDEDEDADDADEDSDEDSDDEEADGDEDESDEDAEESDEEADQGDEDSEEDEIDPRENLDTEHPLFGKWEGVASGFKAVGMPDDTMGVLMIIVVDNDGNITGTSESQGETDDLGDIVRWDADKSEFYSESSEDGMVVTMTATIDGDTMTGRWEVQGMGFSGGFTAERITRELSDEELEEAGVEGGGGSDEDGDDEPVEIDLEGFERRGVQLDIPPGNFGNLATNNKGHLLYLRTGGRGSEVPPSIKIYDITADEPEEKNVISGVGGFAISGDGKKMLVVQGAGKFGIVSAAAGQSISKPLNITLKKKLDPKSEWHQLVREAWRIHRDFFYVENMHGVDWDAVYDHYAPMVDDAASRADVSFIIGEMISELNVGHAYYWGGDGEDQPRESVGLLGCDFELATETDDEGQEHTAYRISKVYEGAPWDSDARGPLSQPGINAGEGDYLLAVNGIELDTEADPWAAFIGLTGQPTTLTLVDALVGDEEARNEREVTIKPIGNEFNLRYRAWVESNRAYVEEKSGGLVGYIHVPNTGVQGQNELFRQFYGQIGKSALIIDERWNGGGQIPTRFIELLNRPRTNYWARRDGKDWPWPYDSHQGPKCMLINGNAGSGGDMFPWLFRHNKIGQIIGTRTWGGLVGISGNPGLIDGGYTSVPTFGFYETDGTWGIEGHGVEPDIEVIDDPTARAQGKNPQLDAGIVLMLAEIEINGYHPPSRPSDPDRSGMGVLEEDQ